MYPISQRAKEAYEASLETGNFQVGYSCASFPPAVLCGLGLEPLRIPVSRVAVSAVPAREDVCPLAGLLAGSVVSTGIENIVGSHTCDMTRRFYQQIKPGGRIRIHQLQVPATAGKASEVFFGEQVKRICRDLSLTCSVEKYDSQRALEWYFRMLEARSYLRSIQWSVPPVALQYFFHLFRTMSPGGALDSVREMVDRFGDDFKGRFTLVLTGSPVIPGDDATAEIVENLGGTLIPVNCTGFGVFPRSLPEDPTIEGMAAHSLMENVCVRRRPNSCTWKELRRETAQCAAQGVLMKTLSFCDLWYTEKVRVHDLVDRPVMVFDSRIEPGERERISIRLEAFIQQFEEGDTPG